MRIISIDPSTRSCGIYMNEDGEQSNDVIRRPEPDRLDVLKWLCLRFVAEAQLGWDLLIIESYAFGASNSRAVTTQAEIGGLIRGIFAAHDIPIVEVPISTWKAVTGISMPKATPENQSDYLNAVARKYHIRFDTVDEADAFLFYRTVQECGLLNAKGEGADHIRHRLMRLKIDVRKM